MTIEKLLIKNYGTISDLKMEFTPGVPTVVIGANGSGKTTITKAIDFAINGTPIADAVKNGSAEAVVTATIDNSNVIERKIQKSPYKTTVSIMGRKATGSSVAALTEEEAGLTQDVIKAAFRRDLMEWLSKGKYTDFFLRHDANRMTVVDMLNLASHDTSTKHKKACGLSEELPMDFKATFSNLFDKLDANLSEIETAHELANERKKSVNRDLKTVQSKCKGFNDIVAPTMTEQEVQDKLAEILMVEKNIDKQRELRTMYANALKNQAEWTRNCEALEAEIKMIPDYPDMSEKANALNEKITSLNKFIISAKTSFGTIKQNEANLRTAISNIENPVCPFSKNIKCATDMTPYLDELKANLKTCESELNRLTSEITEYESESKLANFELSSLNDKKQKTQKKILLIKQLENLRKTPIIVPEEPAMPVKSDYSSEKKALHDLQLQVRTYNEMKKNYDDSLLLKRQSDILTYCEEILDRNGIVVTEYAKNTVAMMSSACRIELMNPNYHVTFMAQDGIVPYFNFGHGYYKYEALSTGEQILAKAVITDLFSGYFNSSVMILDELNDLDAKHFEELMNFIMKIKDSYQNIIMALVNNESLVTALDSYKDNISLISL